MAPRKRNKSAAASSSPQANPRYLDGTREDHYDTVHGKKILQDLSIDFPVIPTYPHMETTTRAYGWMNFNSMNGKSNFSWVYELYVNALGCKDTKYTSYVSYVRRVLNNYASKVIDALFGFRQEEQCSLRNTMRCSTSLLCQARIGDTTSMGEPIARELARWFVSNFEICSNTSEVIMSRCHAVFAIMRGEPIRVNSLIARSIKRLTTAEKWLGHPYVITELCKRFGVPAEEFDDIVNPP